MAHLRAAPVGSCIRIEGAGLVFALERTSLRIGLGELGMWIVGANKKVDTRPAAGHDARGGDFPMVDGPAVG
jgi:hypothetical protein